MKGFKSLIELQDKSIPGSENGLVKVRLSSGRNYDWNRSWAKLLLLQPPDSEPHDLYCRHLQDRTLDVPLALTESLPGNWLAVAIAPAAIVDIDEFSAVLASLGQ